MPNMRYRFEFLLLLLLRPSYQLSCDKVFTYYEEYGQNSFNVSCSGITKGYEHILENIAINNEISLTIADSSLVNITPSIFKNVRNIRILTMFNCTFEFANNVAIFSNLEKLETLIIRDTKFDIDNKTMQGLSSLKHLELDGNGLVSVQSGGLKHLDNLEKLDISNNHVTNLHDLHLCDLSKLKYLNLRSNYIANLSYFFCLKKPPSLDFNVNSLHPHINQETYVNVSNIPYDLIELDLSNNQIVDLGHSMEELDKLRILNVSHNKLSSVEYTGLKWLYRIQKLLLSNNQIRSFDSRIFINKTQLSHVNLSHNNLKIFSLVGATALRQLDLSFNNLSVIYLDGLKNLETLNLHYNRLTKLNYKKLPNVANLNLGHNEIKLSQGMFSGMPKLQALSLSANNLHALPDKVFLSLTNLRDLDLSQNGLETLSSLSFDDLTDLETLDLSSNSIQSLSFHIVEPLDSLRSLDLSGNKLMYIEYDVILSKLPSLSNINIKSNQLTCDNLGQIIGFLKRKHIIYTNSEDIRFSDLSENVAGIPCKPTPLAAQNQNSALMGFGITILVLLGVVLTSIVTYRFYVYLKRRKYRADEFELVVD